MCQTAGTLRSEHNRYEICNKHGIEFTTKEIALPDRDSAKIWIINNQFNRRNINAYQRSVLALKKKEIFAKQGKERQIEGGGAVLQKSVKAVINTQKVLAKEADVSHDTISKVENIEKKATEEQKKKLESGEASINEVYKDIKKEEKKEECRDKSKPSPLPEGKFNVIYADVMYSLTFIDYDSITVNNTIHLVNNRRCKSGCMNK